MLYWYTGLVSRYSARLVVDYISPRGGGGAILRGNTLQKGGSRIGIGGGRGDTIYERGISDLQYTSDLDRLFSNGYKHFLFYTLTNIGDVLVVFYMLGDLVVHIL